jgi:hypothetical protein
MSGEVPTLDVPVLEEAFPAAGDARGECLCRSTGFQPVPSND